MKTEYQEKLSSKAGSEVDESPASQTALVLVYRIDENRYGLFLSEVERVVRAVAITPLADAPENILGIINVQGRIVPVVSMRKKLKSREKDVDLGDQFILAHTRRRTVALVVDSVVGVVEQPTAEIAANTDVASATESLKGVIKLADDLVLVYDLEYLLSIEQEGHVDATFAED